VSNNADSDLAAGDKPFFTVVCWNAEHTRRKLFKNYTDRAQAEIDIKALRGHGIEAELVTVGDAKA